MTGLTPFILAMLSAPDAMLAKASVTKLAAKYDIPVATADFYLSMWRAR